MKIHPIYVFLFPLVITACSHSTSERLLEGDSPIPVRVIAIEPQNVREPVYASGSFTTEDETIRSFKTGGIVQQICVKEGDAIRGGQLLAMLDLTEIKAQVNQAELACNKALRDQKRAADLYHDSVATLEQFQNATTALEIARDQLAAARFNQTFSEIRATGDGFVLKKFVNEGQVVAPGTPVFLTNGAGHGNWILKVAVSDGQWNSIRPGDSALIKTDLPGSGTIKAYVSKKAEGADPVSGTFTIDLKPVINLDGIVASGMFGKATITPAGSRKLWMVPYDALLDGAGTKGYVFVTCDRKFALRKKVSIAGISRDHVFVDSGLEKCNNVIITGSAYLSDHKAISIIP